MSYLPLSLFNFISLLDLHLLIYSIYFSIHTYIDLLRPYIDPTLPPQFLLFSLHDHHHRHHISIVFPPPPPPHSPHFYCFPSTTTTTAASFLLFPSSSSSSSSSSFSSFSFSFSSSFLLFSLGKAKEVKIRPSHLSSAF